MFLDISMLFLIMIAIAIAVTILFIWCYLLVIDMHTAEMACWASSFFTCQHMNLSTGSVHFPVTNKCHLLSSGRPTNICSLSLDHATLWFLVLAHTPARHVSACVSSFELCFGAVGEHPSLVTLEPELSSSHQLCYMPSSTMRALPR